MENKINPWRLLVKALLLYVAVNLAFSYFNPPVGKLSLYNTLVAGRERFPFERTRGLQAIYNVAIFEDLDALFASHIISAAPKPADEYRVILLGDSSVWGLGSEADNTITEQLNRLDLKSCDGRNVRFYNLGYPGPFVLKDMLLLKHALTYQPDMALWFVTLYSFTPTELEEDAFIAPHVTEIKQIVDTYEIKDYTRGFDQQRFWDRTVFGQRVRMKRYFELQMFALPWQATGIDYQQEEVKFWKTDIPADETYLNRYNSAEEWNKVKHSFTDDILDAGTQLAGDTRIVFVNEPIFAADPNQYPLRYNAFYPRWTYDAYREYLSFKMSDSGYIYADLWNVIPNEEFSDDPFHLTTQGEQMLAEKLSPYILNNSCQ